uniref:Cytochrome b561 n=1 Tax=Candidatus Kentrum sp. SD TaxID=2126332 RepID=A0A450YZ69_9GAMM|nr:MAG: hypothetical protein BECKSD772F_GA0070984_10834 [Candidatus Kentron sp. SD]VFK46823.1 MAG: hypothetical protein BECKSD772E_GA0070983_10814 [Candidatus Kentron sp. SD]VFK79149.1 MAG: hypothetical protein BECKSD772D_GA0070982_103723 [Candidatus Kentron sp. SD]
MTNLVHGLQGISISINPKKYAVFGFLSLLIVAIWLGAGYRWEWLIEIQGNKLYKQFSGFALLALILQQWRFGLRRFTGGKMTMGFMNSHKLLGCLLPLVILFHVKNFGVAYQRMLAAVILVNCLIGILNIEIVRFEKPFFHDTWMALHISLAAVGLALAVYHVYVVYLY